MSNSTNLSNIRPIWILSGYLLLACTLTGSILRLLFKIGKSSYSRLSWDWRHWKNVVVFASLSAVSLGITWYHMLAFFALSYRTWAYKNDVPLPERLWGPAGIVGEGAVTPKLGPWLKETTLFKNAWETVIDGPAKFWWSQQIFLITAVWSVFLGVKGITRHSHRDAKSFA